MNNLTVIVPAFNEATSIGPTLHGLKRLEGQLAERGFHLRIYVINDGSVDETVQHAREAGADRIVSHKTNLGLGAAVRTGLRAAFEDGADIAIKFDADLQHDPTDVIELIKPITDDVADIVYGSRFERISYPMPFVRRVGNAVFTTLMRWLTGWEVRDGQPGIFAVNRAYLACFRLPGDYNYTQQILLDAYHKGMRFAHVPVSFSRRESGTSFVTFKYPFRVIYQIFLVLLGVKPMRVFGSLGLVFLTLAFSVFCYELVQYSIGATDKPIESVNLVLGLGLFGVQTLFFGALAQLIIETRRS